MVLLEVACRAERPWACYAGRGFVPDLQSHHVVISGKVPCRLGSEGVSRGIADAHQSARHGPNGWPAQATARSECCKPTFSEDLGRVAAIRLPATRAYRPDTAPTQTTADADNARITFGFQNSSQVDIFGGWMSPVHIWIVIRQREFPPCVTIMFVITCLGVR